MSELPPHEAQAEEMIIASAIENPKWLPVVCRIPGKHFYLPGVRTIHSELVRMANLGEAVDMVTLQGRLKDDGLLEKCGGIAYLMQLVSRLTSSENVPVWMEMVDQKYQLRKILNVCAEVSERIQANNASLDDLKFSVQSDLAEVFGGATGAMPEMVDGSDFMLSNQPLPAELIAGILHQGSKLALGGSSKSFKTWTLLDLGLSVASGFKWLGCQTVKGPVLYVNFEIQPHMWQRRLQVVAQTKGIEIVPGLIQLWNLRGWAADYRQLMPKVIQRAKSDKFALIILDPIYKLYGGTDENAAGDVAALLNSMENLAVETGAAVAFGTHFAKGNASTKEAIDRISGSGVFARDPDSLLIFTRHEEDEAFTVEPILRNFAPVDPFVVRWNYPIFERDDTLDPQNLKKQVGRKKEHDPLELVAAIADRTPENPISVPDWSALLGMARTTLSGYLNTLREKGWIKTVGEGSHARQSITLEGRAALTKRWSKIAV
jgi:hypothetical protein